MKQSPIQEQHIKKLEWVFSLLQANLDDLREGHWMILREDLLEFVYGTRQPQFMSKQNPGGVFRFASIPVLEKEDYKKIQNSIKHELLILAKKSDYPFHYVTSAEEGCDFVASANSPSEPFTSFILIRSIAPETPVLIALWQHLAGAAVTPEQIRICSLERCDSIFLLKRKPRRDKEKFYCSVRCARNAATRTWRDKHRKDLAGKERKRGRQRYVAKQQKKHGLKVNIGRRPRKA